MLSCCPGARGILVRKPASGAPSAGTTSFHVRMSSQADDQIENDDNDERRSNLVLRALIDEMLERVREVNRMSGVWSGSERARAEAELEAIMARVRRVASKNQHQAP